MHCLANRPTMRRFVRRCRPCQGRAPIRSAQMTLLLLFAALNGIDRPTFILAEQQQQQPQQQPAKKNTQQQQVVRYPKWLSTAVKISQQYGQYNPQTNTVVQQKIRNFPTILKLHEIDNYMSKVVHADPSHASVRDECVLKHEYCAEAASGYQDGSSICPPGGKNIFEMNADGLCPDGAGTFMANNCAAACGMCHTLSYESRCAVDGNSEEVKRHDFFRGSGELHDMFERMIHNEELQRLYGPMTVHSRPGGDPTNETDVFDGPYIVTYDEFLTPEECEVLRHHGANTGDGFTRSSTGTSKHVSDSRATVRTSSTNWCRDGCHDDPVVQNIHRRIETLTGIPEDNYEYLQILRYEEGQYYKIHHDYNKMEPDRPQGVRLLTVFLYLSDVEEGGGTRFNELNTVGDNIGDESIPGTGGERTILPKMGRAVIWPSVVDSDPNLPDRRARHGAETVVKGVKYGANAWIHQRSYKESFLRACHDDGGVVIGGI
mmetsp:Transcript_19726/g.43916  ORF Transcript_19726/g.43916 Transcript_19726/m.43916 type:complete len:489 (-) Transcript_19726:224-1690(-)